MFRKNFAVAFAALAVFMMVLPMNAAAYPTNKCVSKKQKAVGKFCQDAAKAWSKYLKNPAKDAGGVGRDAAIAAATTKLGSAFTKAEAKAAADDAECAETTATATTLSADIAVALDAMQSALAGPLNTASDKNDQKCASKLVKSAGKLCASLLKAESKRIKKISKDLDGSKRDGSQTDAATKFGTDYTKAAAKCSGTPGGSAAAVASVQAISDDAYTNTVTSPTLPTAFTQVQYTESSIVNYNGEALNPRCIEGTPYSLFYKRGTVNNLAVVFQGGGACWDYDTCVLLPSVGQAINKRTAGPGDDPSLWGTGLGDFTDPRNPFKDWHHVFVSYCTGDIHVGDNRVTYFPDTATIYHVGRANAKVVEKFAREHFLDPGKVFVTGISAGSYGALFNSVYYMNDVYPQSDFSVVGDAGIGVVTREWFQNSFVNWNFTAPPFIPSMDTNVATFNTPHAITEMAKAFPNARFGSYQTAYDGTGGGQAAFYNVMKNPGAIANASIWAQWWLETCEWSNCMREFASSVEAATPGNFHSYVASGTSHGGGQLDNFYVNKTSVPVSYLEWVQQMLNDDPSWASVDCAAGGGCDPVNACQKGSNEGLACSTNADCPGLDAYCRLDPFPDPPLPKGPYNADGTTVSCAVTACPCDTGSGGVACGP